MTKAVAIQSHRSYGTEVWVGHSGHGLRLLSNGWGLTWDGQLEIGITEGLHLNSSFLGLADVKVPLRDLCTVSLSQSEIPVRRVEAV